MPHPCTTFVSRRSSTARIIGASIGAAEETMSFEAGALNHLPYLHQVAGEIAVSQLHALRQSGGAGREGDSGNRVRVDIDLWSGFRIAL